MDVVWNYIAKLQNVAKQTQSIYNILNLAKNMRRKFYLTPI